MDQREELIAELEKMLARLKALNPEQMAALNKYLSQSREAAFLGEIINRVLDGSRAHEEAERWIKASDQDADEGKVS